MEQGVASKNLTPPARSLYPASDPSPSTCFICIPAAPRATAGRRRYLSLSEVQSWQKMDQIMGKNGSETGWPGQICKKKERFFCTIGSSFWTFLQLRFFDIRFDSGRVEPASCFNQPNLPAFLLGVLKQRPVVEFNHLWLNAICVRIC